MKDWDNRRLPLPSHALKTGDPAWDDFMTCCSDYLKRQILIYQNWPQRRYTPLGYVEEKVFTDMNA